MAPTPPTPPRRLTFPRRHRLGLVAVRPAGETGPETWRVVGRARGTVRIPAGVDVRLDVDARGARDLAGLASLAPDDLQGLNLSWSEVTDAQLVHIGALRDLVALDLGDTAGDLGAATVTDAGLAHAAPLGALRGLSLRRTGITGAALHRLTCDRLEWLDLGETRITDADLGALARFPSLRALSLRRTAVTDAGLKHLAGLTRLRRVELADTAVTDDGAAILAGLPDVEWLDLAYTRISAAGARALAGARRLRTLDLWRTPIPEDAVELLRSRLPDCDVVA